MANSGEWVESAPSLRNTRLSSKTFSKPPTTQRLRNNPGDPQAESASRALECVTNGRLPHPGQCLQHRRLDSRKPRRSRPLRTARTTAIRWRATVRACGRDDEVDARCRTRDLAHLQGYRQRPQCLWPPSARNRRARTVRRAGMMTSPWTNTMFRGPPGFPGPQRLLTDPGQADHRLKLTRRLPAGWRSRAFLSCGRTPPGR